MNPSRVHLKHRYIIQGTPYVTEADNLPLSIVTSVYTYTHKLPKFVRLVSVSNLLPPQAGTNRQEKLLKESFSSFKGSLNMEVQGLTVDHSSTFVVRTNVKGERSPHFEARIKNVISAKVEDWEHIFRQRLIDAIESSANRCFRGYYLDGKNRLRYCPAKNQQSH